MNNADAHLHRNTVTRQTLGVNMGLLDLEKLSSDPLLQAGLGILANNTGNYGAFAPAFGKGTMQGLQQANQFRQNQLMNEARKQQFDMQKSQYDQQKQQEKLRAEAIGGISQEYGINPNLLSAYPEIGQKIVENRMIPKSTKLAFAPNGVAYDENNPTLKVGENYAKSNDNTPSEVQEYEYAKGQGYNGSYLDFQLAQKRAGASTNNVSVNTGQKGFDNTLKLRGDFRSEPIYKAHQEVRSAHSQITAALKQESPAGDLAGATKLMKILDPGSVVRESELGMAMSASGAMDRLTNYAQMAISGQKLTPTQRKDFQSLSDSLLNESSAQYNAKRDEYKGISERNGLNEQDVLGNADIIPNGKNSSLGGSGWSAKIRK